ncbi:hypothetical protein DSECCO2_569210 [anaerobic digester metagenome]
MNACFVKGLHRPESRFCRDRSARTVARIGCSFQPDVYEVYGRREIMEGFFRIVAVRRAPDEEPRIARRPGHREKRPVHGGRIVEAERYPPAPLLPGAPDQGVGRDMLECPGDRLRVEGDRLGYASSTGEGASDAARLQERLPGIVVAHRHRLDSNRHDRDVAVGIPLDDRPALVCVHPAPPDPSGPDHTPVLADGAPHTPIAPSPS